MTPDLLRINDKNVAHEIFDGEVLAINLETGTYYSLRGISAEIWILIAGGHSLADIVAALSAIYDAAPETIAASVREFADTLVSAALVTPAGNPPVPLAQAPVAATRKPFVAPEMSVYSDMQDLLLLDPIHDVDEAGWPLLKPGVGVPPGS